MIFDIHAALLDKFSKNRKRLYSNDLAAMKILLLAPHPFFQNRGTPIAVRMLTETLTAAGHTIHLLTFPEGEDVDIDSCTITRVRRLSWATGVKPGFSGKKLAYDALLFREAIRVLDRDSFDLIHAVEESAFIAAYLGKRYGIPYVYDMDSLLSHQLREQFFFLRPVEPLLRFMEKKIILRAAGVIPVCKAIEEIVLQYNPDALVGRLEDVTLLPAASDEKAPKGTRLGLDKEKIHIMYVGNLEVYQGINLLLEAFRLACKIADFARLVIIGGADRDIDRYRKKSIQLGISDCVVFVGRRPVTDLHHYLSQADILVSPRTKGFNTPMKIYSYLDSGKPVLATRMQTHTQVLDDEIAYLTEATATDMASGLVKLIEDESLRHKLGANARRAAREYTREAFDRKLNYFYSRLEDKIT